MQVLLVMHTNLFTVMMGYFTISVLLFTILQLCSTLPSEFKSYKNFKIYEIEGPKNDVLTVLKLFQETYDIPIHEFYGDKLKLLVAPALTPVLDSLVVNRNLKSSVVVDDFSKLIDSEIVSTRGRKPFSWSAYYDVDDIYDYLGNVSAAFRESTELIEGGRSFENRKILGLRINTPGEHDKPVIFIESGIHAREWIAPATTTYFINQLLTSPEPRLQALRDQFDWRIFPTVNPDGYHFSFRWDRMWRKTRSVSSNSLCHGADPNRNWDYNWMTYSSSSNPCDYQLYAGSKPFSEVETRTLSEYISTIENLRGYIAFHSYAQCVLLPYSDSTDHVDNYDDLYAIGKTSIEYGKAVNGETYDGPATAGEILYKASGGSMDWVRHALGTPLVYTYELRGQNFHWPAYRIPEQGDEVTQMMLGLVTEANNLGYF